MTVSITDLHNDDWLAWLFRKLDLTPFLAGIAMLALNLAINLPLAICFGIFKPGTIPKTSIPADLIYEILIHPLILAYFCWFQSAGAKLFAQIQKGKIIDDEDHFDKVMENYRGLLQWRWLSFHIGLVSILLMAWFLLAFNPDFAGILYQNPPYRSWTTVSSTITWARIPALFLVIYSLLMVIYDLIVTVIALRWLFKDQVIRMDPLDPDRAGGLGVIGGFSADLSYIIGALGALFSVRFIQAEPSILHPNNIMIFSTGIAYLIAAPILFFLPLWTAHKSMLSYRKVLLKPISKKYNDLVSQMESNLKNDKEKIQDLVASLEKFYEARTLIMNQVPVWPYNFDNLKRFFGFTLSPFVPAVISFIVDLMTSKLLGD